MKGLLPLSILSTVQDIWRSNQLLNGLRETIENTFDDGRLRLLRVRNILRNQGCRGALEDVLADSGDELRIRNLGIRSVGVGDRRVISMSECDFPSILEVRTGAGDIDLRILSDLVTIESNDDSSTPIGALDEVGSLLVFPVEVSSRVHTQELRSPTLHTSPFTDRLRCSLEQSR